MKKALAQLKISCSQCGQHIQCDGSYQGVQFNCPNCSALLTVPEAQESEKPKRRRQTISKAKKPQPRKKSGMEAFIAAVTQEDGQQLDSIETTPAPRRHSGANLTAEQVAILEESIRGTLKNVVIQGIRVVHIGGTQYKAHLTIMTAQGTERCVADVNFDGENFVWQIGGQAAQGSMGLRVLGLLILIFCGWLFYSTWNEYQHGELVLATARAGASTAALHWKEYFIEIACFFGVCVGTAQLCTGRRFESLPWLRIIFCWGVSGR